MVAVCDASEEHIAYRAAVVLAWRIGKQPSAFPGSHSGISSQPEAYAGRRREVLSTC